jgi:hypothetical protein
MITGSSSLPGSSSGICQCSERRQPAPGTTTSCKRSSWSAVSSSHPPQAGQDSLPLSRFLCSLPRALQKDANGLALDVQPDDAARAVDRLDCLDRNDPPAAGEKSGANGQCVRDVALAPVHRAFDAPDDPPLHVGDQVADRATNVELGKDGFAHPPDVTRRLSAFFVPGSKDFVSGSSRNDQIAFGVCFRVSPPGSASFAGPPQRTSWRPGRKRNSSWTTGTPTAPLPAEDPISPRSRVESAVGRRRTASAEPPGSG